jgi:hypothetical protein
MALVAYVGIDPRTFVLYLAWFPSEQEAGQGMQCQGAPGHGSQTPFGFLLGKKGGGRQVFPPPKIKFKAFNKII